MARRDGAVGSRALGGDARYRDCIHTPTWSKLWGDEKRKALKEHTATMIDTPRPHVENRLVADCPHAWPHLRDGAARRDATESFITKGDQVGRKISQTIPDSVSSMLGSVLSDMADLLEPEGSSFCGSFQAVRARIMRNPEWWQAQASRGLRDDAHDGRLRAAGHPYFAGLNEREQVHVQRERADAKELWGNA